MSYTLTDVINCAVVFITMLANWSHNLFIAKQPSKARFSGIFMSPR